MTRISILKPLLIIALSFTFVGVIPMRADQSQERITAIMVFGELRSARNYADMTTVFEKSKKLTQREIVSLLRNCESGFYDTNPVEYLEKAVTVDGQKLNSVYGRCAWLTTKILDIELPPLAEDSVATMQEAQRRLMDILDKRNVREVEALHELLKSELSKKSSSNRLEIAKNVSIDPPILAALAEDDDSRVRLAVAQNHLTPIRTLTGLSEKDENDEVRKASNKNLMGGHCIDFSKRPPVIMVKDVVPSYGDYLVPLRTFKPSTNAVPNASTDASVLDRPVPEGADRLQIKIQ